MRLRKNLKLSEDSSENGPLQPHHCQLNQNPWDIEPLSSSPPSPYQLGGDNNSVENGGLGDFAGALQSVASLRIYTDDEEEEEKEKEIIYCSKTDETGNFICGLEAKEGETLCAFHLRGHIALTKKSNKSVKNGGKKSKFESESNPYQSLYYYSGFGPSWRKRRGVQESSKNNEAVANTLSSANQLDHNSKGSSEDEVVEEEEDVEVENYKENGKKRGRKRIKARSLKSLILENERERVSE